MVGKHPPRVLFYHEMKVRVTMHERGGGERRRREAEEMSANRATSGRGGQHQYQQHDQHQQQQQHQHSRAPAPNRPEDGGGYDRCGDRDFSAKSLGGSPSTCNSGLGARLAQYRALARARRARSAYARHAGLGRCTTHLRSTAVDRTPRHVVSCCQWARLVCVCVCVCLFIYTYIHNTFFRPPGSNPLSRVYKRPTMTCVYIHAHTHTHTHTHTPTNVVLFIISI